jgi:acyl-CoA thioesterase
VSGPDTFAGATAVRPDPDVAGRWHADIPPGWNSPGGIHGGVLAATILRAVCAEVGDPGLRLRSAHVSFRSPPTDPRLVIDVAIARRGGITAHVEATARGAAQTDPSTVLTTLFTRDKAVDSYLDAVVPDAPGPDECVSWHGASDTFTESPLPSPPVFDHLEMRSADGGADHSGPYAPIGRRAFAYRWSRYRVPLADADGAIDPLMLVPIADFPGVAVWSRYEPDDTFTFVTSLEFDIHFLEDPTDEWVLGEVRSRWMGDGYAWTETDLWSAGRLVGVSSQMMLLRPMGPR